VEDRRRTAIAITAREKMKPANPPIEVPGNTPFQKMGNLLRAVIAVPKAEIDRREEKWKRAQARKKKAVKR
jgi:hypothetical protein